MLLIDIIYVNTLQISVADIFNKIAQFLNYLLFNEQHKLIKSSHHYSKLGTSNVNYYKSIKPFCSH